MDYFLYRDGKQIGPLSVNEIAAGLASGKYSQSEHVWHEGLSQSKMLSEVFQAQSKTLPSADVKQPASNSGISAKIRQAIRSFAQGQRKDGAFWPSKDEPSQQSKGLNETEQMPAALDQEKSELGIPATVMQTIRRFAQQEYPDDYAMQRHIIDEQRESFSAIQALPMPGIPGSVYAKIREKAVAEYPDDYSMQKYTIEEQVDAYRQLYSR